MRQRHWLELSLAPTLHLLRLCLVLPVLLVLPSCIDRLPDQDLRILSATPAARLSADILWKDYATDAGKANRQYFGEAIIVTGNVTALGSNTPTDRFILFGQTNDYGVRANLLDEQATAILERAQKEPTMTLKCFCEGLNGHVILKSCVQP
jgi:hypothetical protein